MPFTKKSGWVSWTPVTMDELKAFLRVLSNIPLNPKTEIADYFSTSWINHQPFFKSVFSRQPFLQTYWNLHISKPEENIVGRSQWKRQKRPFLFGIQI